jgi:hypothetical protein
VVVDTWYIVWICSLFSFFNKFKMNYFHVTSINRKWVHILKKNVLWLQCISLIPSEKFYLLLFQLVRDYFTSDQKYFFIHKISGFSSFRWYIVRLSFLCFHGEISGLRKIPPPDAIRRYFPNYDALNKTHGKIQF